MRKRKLDELYLKRNRLRIGKIIWFKSWYVHEYRIGIGIITKLNFERDWGNLIGCELKVIRDIEKPLPDWSSTWNIWKNDTIGFLSKSEKFFYQL